MDCEEFARSKADAQEDSSLHVLLSPPACIRYTVVNKSFFVGDRSNLWVEAVPKM